MSHIRPRSPTARLVRNLALLWSVLSIIALVVAGALLVYGMAIGCTDGADGWGACVGLFSIGVFASLSSLFMATIALVFSQLFYMAGAEVTVTAEKPRFSVRGFFSDLIVDIFD